MHCKERLGCFTSQTDYSEKDCLSFYSRRGIEQSLSSLCLRITSQHYLSLWITSFLNIVCWLSWGRDGYLWEEQGLSQVHILAMFLFCTPHDDEPQMFPQYTCVVHTFYSPHSSAWTLLPKPRTQQACSLEILNANKFQNLEVVSLPWKIMLKTCGMLSLDYESGGSGGSSLWGWHHSPF